MFQAPGEGVAASQMPLGASFAGVVDAACSGDGASISKFLNDGNPSPFVEDDIAHFWYHGEAQDVAVGCDVFGARQERQMQRAGESDFFLLLGKTAADATSELRVLRRL